MAKAKTQADDPVPSTVISPVSNTSNASSTSTVSAVDNLNLSTVAKEDAKVLASQTDVFLSHDWGVDQSNHKRVSRINDYLKAKGIKTWFDEDRLGGGRLNSQLSKAIKYSSIAIVFVTANYAAKVQAGVKSDNCWKEFNYITYLDKPMIPVVMEKEMLNQKKWEDKLAIYMGKDMYVPFDDDNLFDVSAAKLLDFINQKLSEIRQKQP